MYFIVFKNKAKKPPSRHLIAARNACHTATLNPWTGFS
jgi:hypothetical protein